MCDYAIAVTNGGWKLGVRVLITHIMNQCNTSLVPPTLAHAGSLVADFLDGSTQPHEYSSALLQDGDNYNGFNLLTAKLW